MGESEKLLVDELIERLRSVMPDESPLDLEQQALSIAGEVMRAKGMAKYWAEFLSGLSSSQS